MLAADECFKQGNDGYWHPDIDCMHGPHMSCDMLDRPNCYWSPPPLPFSQKDIYPSMQTKSDMRSAAPKVQVPLSDCLLQVGLEPRLPNHLSPCDLRGLPQQLPSWPCA